MERFMPTDEMDANTSRFQIEGYQLLEALGKGGFGAVFRANRNSTGQVVAVKFLQIGPAADLHKNRRLRERFEREVQMCAKLHHPHVVQLLDKGWTAENTPYTVFEFVPGQSLKDLLLTRGALPVTETKELMGQVLDALSYAHKLGIVHRDLKPQNIIVMDTGIHPQIKILDFGIGAFTRESRQTDYKTLTITQETLGTPSYSAPEQLRGEPITPKSDYYSWGLLFLECLTGQPVIQGMNLAEVFQKQLSPLEIPLPPAIASHPLGNLLRSALRKDPRNRVEEAKRLYSDLQNLNLDNLVGDFIYSENRNQSHTAGYTASMKSLPLQAGFLGERRVITAMSCHLSVHTLDESVTDFEALESLQRDQMNLFIDIAERYSGQLVGKFGESLLFYFGVLQTGDNEARRASRVALELAGHVLRRNALLKRETGVRLELRIGMHTGEVEIKPTPLPTGFTPDIAIQLERLALPNTILVSKATRQLLETYAELIPSHTYRIGRNRTPMSTYLLTEERRTEAFSFLKNKSIELIGRQNEFFQLQQVWEATKRNRSSTVLLRGEPGIGKSRLAHEIRQFIRNEGFLALDCRCLLERQNHALYPILEMLKLCLHIPHDIESLTATKRLEVVLQNCDCPLEESMPILCSWLSVPLLDRFAPIPHSPEKQKQILFRVLEQLIATLGQGLPFFLIIEDLHWVDPTSQELIERIVTNNSINSCFLLLTTRPEFSLGGNHNLMTIDLQHLSSTETKALIQKALDNTPIEQLALSRLAERTDGNPLFAEELIAMLRDKNILIERNGVWFLEEHFDSSSVPITLQGLLHARLDRLGMAKGTAQTAAAIGRDFDYQLLVSSSRRDEALVQADLEQMMAAKLIHRRHRVQGESYNFRHMLIRDAAYASMLRVDREEVHLRIAESLEADFLERSQVNLARIAQHYANARVFEKAVDYGTRAAKAALERFLNEETITYSRQVLEWIDRLSSDQQLGAELQINGIQIPALMNKLGWADSHVKAKVDRSQALLRILGDSNPYRVPTLWSVALYHHVASNRQAVRMVIDELMQIAEQSENPGLLVAANTFLGLRYHSDGLYTQAKTALEQALALYDPEKHQDHALVFGLDTRAWAESTLALVLWFSGETMRAHECGDRAVAWSRQINHIPSLGITLLYRALGQLASGNRAAVLEITGELLAITEKYGLPAFEGYAKVVHCWASGEIEKADGILDFLVQIGCRIGLSYYRSLSADVEVENGNWDAALQRIESCLNLCQQIDEHIHEPELLRRKAMILLKKYPQENRVVRQTLEQAAMMAYRQGMFRTEAQATSTLLQHFEDVPEERKQRLSRILKSYPEISIG